MARITGVITDSSGNPLDGILTATITGDYGDNGVQYTKKSTQFSITGGVVNMTLQPTEYRIEFQNEADVLIDYVVKIPEVDVTIDQLMPSGITDHLDTSFARLAQIVTTDARFRSQLATAFNIEGQWDINTLYSKYSVVTINGSSYVYTSDTPSSGDNPESGDPWVLLASKGDPGVGTSGDDSPYAADWDGDTNAPTKNVVYDKVETLAPLDSPNLIGTPTAPVISDIFDTSSRIATTAWVQQWRTDGPGIKSLTNQTMRVEAGPFSFKLAWGDYTTPVVNWVNKVEQTFSVPIPDSFTIDNQQSIVATLKVGNTFDVNWLLRVEPGVTNDAFTLGLTAIGSTISNEAITVSWFIAGA